MKASEVKKWLCRHLLRDKGFICAMPETNYGHGVCDVFSITRSGYVHEWEIKVNKPDLMGELYAVKTCLEIKESPRAWLPEEVRRSSKISKHQLNIYQSSSTHIPSLFSFVIPHEFVSFAQDFLKDSQYGIYSFIWTERYDESGSMVFTCEKKANPIHRLKFIEYPAMLRKACFKIP